MNITIEFGWWLLPFIITMACFGFAWVKSPEVQRSGYLPDIGSAAFGLMMYFIATTVSLVSWLIWALVV